MSRKTLACRVAETFAFAAAGGLAFGLLGMPAGWLSGSIVVVAIAALAGRPMTVPMPILRVLLVAIGISLGAVVTPETLDGMATYPLSIAVLIAAMAVVSFAGSYYLQKVHGWDKVTAYLSAAPGGLSQVMAVGAELKADLRAIAIVQTMRIGIVAVGLPAGMALFGLAGRTTRSIGGSFNPSQLDELAILIAVSTAMAILAHRLRFPGGLMFGAMVTSAALHGSGYIHATVPWWLVNTIMIAFGAVTGSRFAGTPLRMIVDFVGAACGSFAVAIAITAVFAVGLVAFAPLPVRDVIIAFAPGAVDAMMLLALALHADPVYVGAHHLSRIFFVSLTMPLIARRSARLPGRPDAPKEIGKPADKKRPPPYQD